MFFLNRFVKDWTLQNTLIGRYYHPCAIVLQAVDRCFLYDSQRAILPQVAMLTRSGFAYISIGFYGRYGYPFSALSVLYFQGQVI
jgi:hypothetical protein